MNFLSLKSSMLKPNIDFLKFIAIASMTIDHIDYIIFNRELLYLSYIGRLAFPLFAFILAYNFYHNTSNQKKYLERLMIFALVSQPFYSISLITNRLNVFFTLGIGMALLLFFNKKKLSFLPFFFLPFVWVVLSQNSGIPNVEYGLPGVLLVYSVGLFLKNHQTSYGFLVSGFLFFINLQAISFCTFFRVLSTILAVPVVYLSRYVKDDLRLIFKHKYFFYIFYPGHLILLWLIKIIMDLITVL